MSHIPSSAMPHAGPKTEEKSEGTNETQSTISSRAGRLADKARENPKTAIAAGAAVVGAIAAAAIPLVRNARGKSEDAESGGGKKTSAKKSSSKES